MRTRIVAVLGVIAVVAVALVWGLMRGGEDRAVGADGTSAGGAAAHNGVGMVAGQIRGFSLQLNNPTGLKSYLGAIDDIAQMGCTSINFVVAARQADVKAEEIHINWENVPPQQDIEKILLYAKKKGIYTILMPIVLLDKAGTKEWRGVIAPPNWDTWFYHYTNYMKKMATIAKRCDVDLFCVGSELLSTEPMRDKWLGVIKDIRRIYTGKLTYSANWDHYEYVTFWDQLDYIGMNNYNELAKHPGASVRDLNAAWKPIKEKILAYVEQQKKPFLFTEVGWHNLQNTISEPWNYVAEGPVDLNEQLQAYKSFVETWQDVPSSQFMGALIWEWCPGLDGAKHHGAYSLQNTPSLGVVKQWMSGQRVKI